eukprot:1383313-Pyramimonas_sp.AAC.3
MEIFGGILRFTSDIGSFCTGSGITIVAGHNSNQACPRLQPPWARTPSSKWRFDTTEAKLTRKSHVLSAATALETRSLHLRRCLQVGLLRCRRRWTNAFRVRCRGTQDGNKIGQVSRNISRRWPSFDFSKAPSSVVSPVGFFAAGSLGAGAFMSTGPVPRRLAKPTIVVMLINIDMVSDMQDSFVPIEQPARLVAPPVRKYSGDSVGNADPWAFLSDSGRKTTNALLALNIACYLMQVATRGRFINWGAKVTERRIPGVVVVVIVVVVVAAAAAADAASVVL